VISWSGLVSIAFWQVYLQKVAMENNAQPTHVMAKVVGLNLVALLVVMVSLMVWDALDGGGGGWVFGGMIFWLPVHVLVCLVTCIVMFATKRTPQGQAWLVAMFVVGIVGFSACWGGMMIMSDF
jgi:F0F1-type ATP synthase assembly protein I